MADGTQRIIVSFKREATAEHCAALFAANGMTVQQHFDHIHAYIVSVPETTAQEGLSALQADHHVISAGLDFQMQPCAEESYRPGELIVTIKRGYRLSQLEHHIADLATRYGMTLQEEMSEVMVFTVPIGEEQRIVTQLKDDPYLFVETPSKGSLGDIPREALMAGKPTTPYRPGSLIVQFHSHVTLEQIAAVLATHGCSVQRETASLRAIIVAVPIGTEERSAETLSKDSLVEFAEPDYRHTTHRS